MVEKNIKNNLNSNELLISNLVFSALKTSKQHLTRQRKLSLRLVVHSNLNYFLYFSQPREPPSLIELGEVAGVLFKIYAVTIENYY